MYHDDRVFGLEGREHDEPRRVTTLTRAAACTRCRAWIESGTVRFRREESMLYLSERAGMGSRSVSALVSMGQASGSGDGVAWGCMGVSGSR